MMLTSNRGGRSAAGRQAAVTLVIGLAIGGGGMAVANTVSATQFTTVNSATWELKGLNQATLSPTTTETLTGPTTFLNPFDNSTKTDVRTLPTGQGSMYFEAWHWDLPGAFQFDSVGFAWSNINTGYHIEAQFNVTFSQSVLFWGGNTGYTNYSVVTANGSALTRNDVLSAGTYTFVWDFNNNSGGSGTNSGESLLLYFELAPPSAVPGSGLAAVGSLGLAGLARRRRR